MQNNMGENLPKYRASCDSCNEAKVRCSQTRPSCARCLKSQNRRCIYGVSKRSGKHSGEGSRKAVGAKNCTVARSPATPTSTTGIETPPSSSSTIDPRECLQLFSGSSVDSSDLPKDWPFDNHLFMPHQTTTSPGSPATYDHYQLVFEREESHISNVQHHGLGLLDGTSDAEIGSCSRDGSLADQPLSYIQSNTKCASCSISNRQNGDSSTLGTCRCNEVIITQLSLLPVLLFDNQCSTFDVELVQFQEAIRLCAGALACTCIGKDYTAILTISMLIARIISVFERSSAQAKPVDDNGRSLVMTGAMTPVPSPKFSVGIYEIEEEDEQNLKREVWWIQVRKVESLIAGFKDMVAKLTQQQAYQDASQVAAWEKLAVMLDQRIQVVKRDWRVYRDKA